MRMRRTTTMLTALNLDRLYQEVYKRMTPKIPRPINPKATKEPIFQPTAMPEVGITEGGGILVGTGQIQSVSAGQAAFKHMPLIQDKPLAQLASLVQAKEQDCGGGDGAGVPVGVIGAIAQSVVDPGSEAINLKRIIAKVPEPVLGVEFVPVKIIVPVDSSV